MKQRLKEETNKLFELLSKAREYKRLYYNATNESMYYHYKALYYTTQTTINVTQSHIQSLRRMTKEMTIQ